MKDKFIQEACKGIPTEVDILAQFSANSTNESEVKAMYNRRKGAKWMRQQVLDVWEKKYDKIEEYTDANYNLQLKLSIVQDENKELGRKISYLKEQIDLIKRTIENYDNGGVIYKQVLDDIRLIINNKY